jgi:integrase
MSANIVRLRQTESVEMRPVAEKGRKTNDAYRVREHLTEQEVTKLLAALKRNRHGHRDWLIGLVIYRHGLRVSEACDLHWDDIDLAKRQIIVRRLKGSTDSTHYLEKDEHKGSGRTVADLCEEGHQVSLRIQQRAWPALRPHGRCTHD